MGTSARTITLRPSGHTFEVAPAGTVLAAAIDAGLAVPYSCKVGICRACRARVSSGVVNHGATASDYLTAHEREQGYALLCQCSPETDCEIEVEETDDMAGIRPRVVPCRILGMDKLAPDVMRLRLRLQMRGAVLVVAGQLRAEPQVLDGHVTRRLLVGPLNDGAG